MHVGPSLPLHVSDRVILVPFPGTWNTSMFPRWLPTQIISLRTPHIPRPKWERPNKNRKYQEMNVTFMWLMLTFTKPYKRACFHLDLWATVIIFECHSLDFENNHGKFTKNPIINRKLRPGSDLERNISCASQSLQAKHYFDMKSLIVIQSPAAKLWPRTK